MTFVDGVKYFDIENDVADQRIYIDPESTVEDVQILYANDHDRCMEDANVVNFNDLFNNK